MRIGIYGGTFDPVHFGHLILAEQAREQAQLDQVWFLPAAHPPHKSGWEISPFDRRVEMLTLAIAGQEHRFRIDPIESERTGPSYTADTLAILRERHPDNEWFLIVGADCLPDLPGWREPLRIIDQAGLIAAARPGVALWTAQELAEALEVSQQRIRLQILDTPQIDIAARDLRKRAAEGRSILYLVPKAVEVYIRERKLYRSRAN